MDFEKYLQERKRIVEEVIDQHLPAGDDNRFSAELCKAIRHSVSAGGKRIRPILTIATAELFDGKIEDVLIPACAMEFIHTSSLMIDDLPDMDNAEYRRGILAAHKLYGTAVTLLAGAALSFYSFEMIAKLQLAKGNGVNPITQLIQEMTHTAGLGGLLSGQLADVKSQKFKANLKTIEFISDRKTGSLITLSIRAGAIVAGASIPDLQAVTQFGRRLGTAFQIADDILDVAGGSKKMGKKKGVDLVNRRVSFLNFYDLDKAKARLSNLIEESKSFISVYGPKSHILNHIADYIMNRDF